ncbi:hypothetical protein EON63_11465 [archaeon]|nr:MAG: hypothetical protein EON63_11465 [archaeon]
MYCVYNQCCMHIYTYTYTLDDSHTAFETRCVLTIPEPNTYTYTPLERVILTANGNLQRILRYVCICMYGMCMRMYLRFCACDFRCVCMCQ